MQRTADGVPIVMHDDTLDRTTALHGPVAATAWSAIRAGAPAVPSLDALCAWAGARTVGLMLELKQPEAGRDDKLVPAVLAVLRDRSLIERTVTISFDHPSIAQALSLEPTLRTGLLYGRTEPRDWPAGVAGLHVHHGWITAELCDEAHAGGLYVHAWGFEPDRETVERLVSAGVDSLSADDPRRLVSLLREPGASSPGASRTRG